MEYAQKYMWRVVAYSWRDKPILMQEKLPRWVAERVAVRWYQRSDVMRVEGYNAEERFGLDRVLEQGRRN